MIAGVIVRAAANSGTSMSQLAELAARMSHTQWVSISLACGVPVAEQPCRVYVVALLGNL
jgi:hypothetical protein